MNKIEAAFWDADRHWQVLATALTEWSSFDPSEMKAITGNPNCVRLLDQVLFRFMKLQDAFGQRLIPATLMELGEPLEDWSMRDRLNRLEKLGFVDVELWMQWRDLRNQLSHEYPDEEDERFVVILSVVNAAQQLGELLRRWHKKLGM